VLTAAPDLVSAPAARATVAYEMDDSAGALTDLDRAVDLAPDDPALRYNRAYALENADRTEDALTDLAPRGRTGTRRRGHRRSAAPPTPGRRSSGMTSTAPAHRGLTRLPPTITARATPIIDALTRTGLTHCAEAVKSWSTNPADPATWLRTEIRLLTADELH